MHPDFNLEFSHFNPALSFPRRPLGHKQGEEEGGAGE